MSETKEKKEKDTPLLGIIVELFDVLHQCCVFVFIIKCSFHCLLSIAELVLLNMNTLMISDTRTCSVATSALSDWTSN